MNERTISRFQKKIDEPGDDISCHEWIGSRNANNYGLVRVDGKQRLAHRIAWEIANGPIPDGLVVRHNCDNPPCVKTEPDAKWPNGHLVLGTKGDNNRDRAERKGYTRGAQHWAAKVSESDVMRMRDLRAGGMTYRQVAARMGLSYTATHSILTGQTWRHLEAPATPLQKRVTTQRISPDAIELARKMRDDEHRPWREIEDATGYGRAYLSEHLPLRTGYNPNPVVLSPDEADEAVRMRRWGTSWEKLSRHFENRISRMGLYYAWRNKMAWWREAEERVGSGDGPAAVVKGRREPHYPHEFDSYVRGTAHHNAKLDAEKIEMIRALRLGGWSWKRIADQVGVDRSTATRAGTGKGWAHLGAAPELPVIVKGRRGRA